MIFVAGPHASGKTQIGLSLRKYGFLYVDLGPTLRRAFRSDRSNSLSFKKWVKMGEKLQGKNFTNKILAQEIKAILKKSKKNEIKFLDIVIVGSRSLSGIRYLQRNLGSVNTGFADVIVFLDAPVRVLYENYLKREQRVISDQDFKRILNEDEKLGLYTIKPKATYFIKGDGNESKLIKRIHKVLNVR